MDYRAYPILYVDDDPTNLQAMQYLLEDRFTLFTAGSGDEALKVLSDRDVAVLLADMRMPGMNGAEVCTRARELKPDVVRMIVTAYSDLHAAVDAINRGQISRYISKPYKKQEILDILRNAIDFVTIQRGVREMEVRLLRGNPGRRRRSSTPISPTRSRRFRTSSRGASSRDRTCCARRCVRPKTRPA